MAGYHTSTIELALILFLMTKTAFFSMHMFTNCILFSNTRLFEY